MSNLRIALASLILIFSSVTHAVAGGADVGHGGGAWVCRDASDSIKWVKLVDLFEATNQFGLTLDSFSNQPIDAQLSEIALKVQVANPDMLSTYKSVLNAIQSNISMSQNIAIPEIPDANFQVVPAASLCPIGKIAYEQLADYPEGGNVVIASLLYTHLSLVEQAGLLVHETIYKMYRDAVQATNSDLAREAVGYLFSTVSPQNYPLRFLGASSLNQSVISQMAGTSWKINSALQISFSYIDFFTAFGYSDVDFTDSYAPWWHGANPDLGTVRMELAANSDSSGVSLTASWTDQIPSPIISLSFSCQCLPLDSGLDLLRSTTTTIICEILNKSIAGINFRKGEDANSQPEENSWMMIDIDSSTLAPKDLYFNGTGETDGIGSTMIVPN
jgi:hypothetical protein